ncbi:MAG: hypothetical protein ACTS5A_04120 [Candidatus Hodgkinia cicadicola]
MELVGRGFSPAGLHGWDCNPMVGGWKDGLCCVRNRGVDWRREAPGTAVGIRFVRLTRGGVVGGALRRVWFSLLRRAPIDLKDYSSLEASADGFYLLEQVQLSVGLRFGG